MSKNPCHKSRKGNTFSKTKRESWQVGKHIKYKLSKKLLLITEFSFCFVLAEGLGVGSPI